MLVTGALAPSVRPGATALTTPAIAAVSAPAPITVALRTRPIRANAASRSRCAAARSGFAAGLNHWSRQRTWRSRSAVGKSKMRIQSPPPFSRNGRRTVNSAPSTVIVPPVALDDRRDDRQPEAGARALGRVGAAPEALEQPLIVVRIGPRSLVADGQQRRPIGRPQADDHEPARRAVDEPVLDQVLEQPLQRVAVAGDRGRRRSSAGRDPATVVFGDHVARPARRARPGRSPAVGRADPLERRAGRRPAAPAARRRGAGPPAPRGSAPWRASVLDVAEQRRDRRAQLVRGVGEKPPLARACLLERRRASGSARRSAARSRRASPVLGQPLRRVGGPLDLARGDRQPAQRVEHPAGQHRRGERRQQRDRRRRSARRTKPRWRSVLEMSLVSEATSTAPPAAGPPRRRRSAPRTSGTAGRRRVMFSIPVRPCASAEPRARPAGRSSRAERQRAREDPAARVDHLDRRARGRRPGSRARRGRAARAGADTASCATSCARWRSAVSSELRSCEPTTSTRHDREHDHRGQDRDRGGQREASAQRSRKVHARNCPSKPTKIAFHHKKAQSLLVGARQPTPAARTQTPSGSGSAAARRACAAAG